MYLYYDVLQGGKRIAIGATNVGIILQLQTQTAGKTVSTLYICTHAYAHKAVSYTLKRNKVGRLTTAYFR
jgi:hypothetical protein